VPVVFNTGDGEAGLIVATKPPWFQNRLRPEPIPVQPQQDGTVFRMHLALYSRPGGCIFEADEFL
jgi:hypothetical protein